MPNVASELLVVGYLPAPASHTAAADARVDFLPPCRQELIGLSRRTGITQPSTRFFRSFNAAVLSSLRSALRLSIPIMGLARSTANS